MKVLQDISKDGVSAQSLPPPELLAKAELLSAMALFQAALDGAPAELSAEPATDSQQQGPDEAPLPMREMTLPPAGPLFSGAAPSGAALADSAPQSAAKDSPPLPGRAIVAAAGQTAVPAGVPAAVSSAGVEHAEWNSGMHDAIQAGLPVRHDTAPTLAPPLKEAAVSARRDRLAQAPVAAGDAGEIASAGLRFDLGAAAPVSGTPALPDLHIAAVSVASSPQSPAQLAPTPLDRTLPGAQPNRSVAPAAAPQGSDIDAVGVHDTGGVGDTPSYAAGASGGSPLAASGSVPLANFRPLEGTSNPGERAATLPERPRVLQNPPGLVVTPAGADRTGLTAGVAAGSGAPLAGSNGAAAVDMPASPVREMVISIPSQPGTTLYASVQNGQLAMQVVSSNASFVSQLKSLLPEIESAFNRLTGRSVQISASLRRGGSTPAGDEPAGLRADADGMSTDEDSDTQTA